MDTSNLLPQTLSPTAYQIGQYGRTPVSYFHGLPQISVPLTEVRGRGITIPVSLSYHGGGIKTEQHPGWVGLGWSLNAGGCITRVIHGFKDEMSAEEHEHVYGTNTSSDPGYLYHAAEIQNSPEWSKEDLWNNFFYGSPDYEPDEYILNAPGLSCSFILLGNHEICVISKDSSVITLEEIHINDDRTTPLLDMYPGQITAPGSHPIKAKRYCYIDRIVIRDSQGNRYVFGGTEDAVEYSVIQYPGNIGTIPSPINDGSWDAVATANTWMLTRLERADGETIVFNYVREGVPIVLHDIHHGCIYTTQDVRTGPLHITSGNIIYKEDTKDIMNIFYGKNLSFAFLLPCYLSEIRCLLSGDRVCFETEISIEKGYEISEVTFTNRVAYLATGRDPGPFSYEDFRRNDHYRKLVRIHGTSRDIRLEYTDNDQTRLKLTKVRILSGMTGNAGESEMEWSFVYDPTPLPGYNSRQTDRWGYYNGRCNTGTTNSAGQDMDTGRDPDVEKMMAETLTEVHYPTGGWTEYQWEPHRYGMRVLPPTFHPDCEDSGVSGGLRIASIIDHTPEGQQYARTFSYTENGVSSGIISNWARYEASGRYENTFLDRHDNVYTGYYEFFYMYSEQPIMPLSETDGCHVTYSTVKEIFPDGGFVVYRYTNHDVECYRDQNPIEQVGEDLPGMEGRNETPLYCRISSRSLQRGLLLSKEIFRSDGTMVYQELMSYAESSAQTYKIASIDKYAGGRLVFLSYMKEPCGYPALRTRTMRELCDDGSWIEDRYEYTYNANRLLTGERHKRGESSSEETRTFYPTGRPGRTSSEMVAEGFTGLALGMVRLRDDNVVEAQELTYKEIPLPMLSERASSRPTWRPCRSYSSRIEIPVTMEQYLASPMSYMQASPDLEVKLFDDTAAPLFAGMKDGSATEFHWSPRHGQPGMVLRTKDMDFQDDLVREQHDMVLGRQLIAEGTFRTTRASTFSCYLSPEYGYAFYVAIVVDGVNHYMVYWSGDGMPDEHWMDLLDRYDGAVSINLDAGNHSFQVRYLELDGPGMSYGTVGGYVSLNYCQARDSGSVGKFLSLDEGSGPAEGFHCGHGHAGPLTVSHDIIPGMNYVLDYMERQTDGEWRYVRTAYNGGNVTIGGSGKVLSNVRIYPEGSMPESYSYRDFVGMSAKTDARGVSESYGYDALGRLSEIRDNDGILGKELSYLFATAGGGTGTDNSVRTTEYNYGNTGNAIAKTTVSHLDGLGRPVQETIVGGGGDGGDIITRKEYDTVGREFRNYIPTPGGSSSGTDADSAPYSENEYEASPRDRTLSVTGPGQAWRAAGKKVSTEMFTNGSAAGSAELRHQGFTVALTVTGMVLNRNAALTSHGMLNVTKTTSEDEDVTLVFKDMHGDEVLTRRVLTDSVTGDVTYVDTHTVRDAFGRVAAVLSPKLTKQLEASGLSQWSWDSIENLAFLYRYDSRGNCIAKNIPGGGWTYMAYDKGGRCVFTQDAVQREQGRWAFRLTDILGRECVTGTVVRTMDVDSDPIALSNIYVSLPSSPDYSGTLKGYDLSGLSSLGTDPRILTVSYYDGYGFNAGDSVLDYSAPSSSETYGRQSLLTATGLLTGRLVRVLDGTASETFLKDVMFYDDKGRVIQRCSTNIFGKKDREYIAYDFAGNVTKRKVEHGKPGTTSVFTETLTSTFDAMGRPLKTTHKAGTATSRTVNNRIYDSVGRLSSLSRINPPVAALTQTYSYNIRSWLTAIGGTLFREEIDYCTGNDPRWDGKISGIRWKNPSETAWRSYRYSYDGLSRLTKAEYDENGRSGAFTERYGYDLNGNMRTRSTSVFDRDGQGGESPMLSLNQYAYVGNRLGSSFLRSYTYDACGRLTGSSEDMVRSTEYNEIGLPLEMTLSDGSVVRTVYAADGRKLRETTVLAGTSATRSYSGSCIFEGNTLKKVLFEGGYAQMSGSTPSYMFFLTDHLGSVRVVAAQNADVKQVNQYYPFGDLIADSHVTAGTSDNRYRFIGKEFGERTGLYDFSARYLEPSMGRFTTIDPLAEKYPSISPYAYCAGDPVNMVDLDGTRIRPRMVLAGIGMCVGGGSEVAAAVGISASTSGLVGPAAFALTTDGMLNITSGVLLIVAGFAGDDETQKRVDDMPKNIPEVAGNVLDKATKNEEHKFQSIGGWSDVFLGTGIEVAVQKTLPKLIDLPIIGISAGSEILMTTESKEMEDMKND